MKQRHFTDRLSVRLMVMFILLLLFFGAAQRIIYDVALKRLMLDHYSSIMQRNAYAVSQNIYDVFVPDSRDLRDDTRLNVSAETLAPYMAMVEQLTRCRVYIVDAAHSVSYYSDGVVQTIRNHLFPGYIEQTIALGFMGKTPVIESMPNRELMLSACTPIMNADSRVLGVVLLTAEASELGYLQLSTGSVVFISFALAAVLAVLLGFVMSRYFSRPLKKAEMFARTLSEGDYSVRLPSRRRDEVGSLTRTINILAERLQIAQKKEQEFQNQQQEFFSNISHELKTPVTVIRGSLEAMHDGVLTPEKREAYYTRTILEIRSLDRLIRDMLELSRLRSLHFQLDFRKISLNDLISDTAMSAAGLCEHKGVQFECPPPEREYTVLGDPSRLRQMLMTVLDNAVKFTDTGKTVSLCLEEGKTPSIVITDQGPGIAPEDLKKLFERFYSTGQRAGEGTGLGLTIAREIANRHGIRIDVTSVQNKGTTFRFVFPTYQE